MMNLQICPVCGTSLARPLDAHGSWTVEVDCTNCGQHWIGIDALNFRPDLYKRPNSAAIAHMVSRLPSDDPIDEQTLLSIARTAKLPSPEECIDNLISHIAKSGHAGAQLELDTSRWVARLGCRDSLGATWVMNEAIDRRLIKRGHDANKFCLTGDGWKHHETLLRNGSGSRHAFMAMDFNNADIARLFNDHLIPAVAAAGFDLRTTEHAQKTAGLIDNRMRVEIRTARFVVVDLTHHNRGAYWEAGFAEGLGRPVFYICNEDVLKASEKIKAPHFDTAHQTIVPWRMDNMAEAAAELKAMIRATLPGEAKLSDGTADGGDR